MRTTINRVRASGPARAIDVLSFPPDQARLDQQRIKEACAWQERERRARVVYFLGAGTFLAWAAGVGAAFDLADSGGSTFFGVAIVPLALIVVTAYVYGRWAIERAVQGVAEVRQQYSDVTLREAAPLLKLAREHAPVAQYLRCVGRQGRPLLKCEQVALHAWVNRYGRQSAAKSPPRG